MKNMKVGTLTVAAICLLYLPVSHTQAKRSQTDSVSGEAIEQQVKTLNNRMIEASLKGETGVLEKYYANDCLVIHGDGKLSTKAQEIEDFKIGAIKYDTLDVREQKVLAYGDTAIVNVLVFVRGTFHGKPLSSDVRATRVWVRQKGDWQNVLFQVTRVPAASP